MVSIHSGIADGFSAATQDPLVAIFFLLFVAAAVIFIASLFIEAVKPKRWMSLVALLLAAGFAIAIEVENPKGFMGAIGGVTDSFFSKVIEQDDNGGGGSSNTGQVNTGTQKN